MKRPFAPERDNPTGRFVRTTCKLPMKFPSMQQGLLPGLGMLLLALLLFTPLSYAEQLQVHQYLTDKIEIDEVRQRVLKYEWYNGTPVQKMGERYDVLLTRSALSESRLCDLKKMSFYLDAPLPDDLDGAYRTAERDLDKVYQEFVDALDVFHHGGSPQIWKDFSKACETLDASIQEMNRLLDRSEAELRAKAKAVPGWTLPEHIGPQPRSIPPLEPTGRSNRILFGTREKMNVFPDTGSIKGENRMEYYCTKNIRPQEHLKGKAPDFSNVEVWFKKAISEGYSLQAMVHMSKNVGVYCPYWFLEGHRDDPEILFRSWDGLLPIGRYYDWKEKDGHLIFKLKQGRDYLRKTGTTEKLNYHHPAVKNMARTYLQEVASFCKRFPQILFYEIGQETRPLITTSKGTRTPGYSGMGTRAWQDYLREKYGTISKLNLQWGACYESFGAVRQPKDYFCLNKVEKRLFLKKPRTPLWMEFEAFRNHAHIEFLKMLYETLKKSDPSRPVAVRYGNLFGGTKTFHARVFEACDILAAHTNAPDMSMHNVYLASLLRYNPGKGLGYLEDFWGVQEEKDRAEDERIQRRGLEKHIYRTAVWGRTVQTKWGGGVSFASYWKKYNGFLRHPGHDFLILKYCAPGQLTARRRVLQIDWPMTHSQIAHSRILLINPTTSVRAYACNQKVLGAVHQFLYPRNYQYELLPEEYIMDDRVNLNTYDVVFLVHAPYLPRPLAKKLSSWVKAGGILITTSRTGIYDEFGILDGTLFNELFVMPWEDQYETQKHQKPYTEKPSGNGDVIIISNLTQLNTNITQSKIVNILENSTIRNAWSQENRFEVLVREDENGHTWVSVLNTNPEKTVTDTVVISKRVKNAVDVLVPGYCPISPSPLKSKSSPMGTQFRLRLGPAGSAFLYCE